MEKMASCILIIDDDATWRGILARALREAGYKVFEAEDGRVGLELWQEYQPMLVITDVFMPEQDGLEILRVLRDDAHKPKILAMSGSLTEGLVDFLSVASKLGADKVLRKPFAAGALLSAVRALIGYAVIDTQVPTASSPGVPNPAAR
jgi:DNA-binding response OmpR family regulator